MNKSLTVLLLLLLLAGCARTMIKGAWENDQYAATPLRTVTVFALRDDLPARQAVEDRMVAQLRKKGVDARPGYQLAGSLKTLARVSLRQELAAARTPHVLVVREFDPDGAFARPRAVSDIPPDYQEFYEYFQGRPEAQNVRDVLGAHANVTVETNLYDVGRDQIVFSIISDTVRDADRNTLIDDFCAEVLTFMERQGYLP